MVNEKNIEEKLGHKNLPAISKQIRQNIPKTQM